MTCSLIANSGIQIFTFPITIDLSGGTKLFREWLDRENSQWRLDLAYRLTTDNDVRYYTKKDLFDNHVNTGPDAHPTAAEIDEAGVMPFMIDRGRDEDSDPDSTVYKVSLDGRHSVLDCFIGQWLPAPYFFMRTKTRLKFGSLNWVRFKLVRDESKTDGSKAHFNVLLAFDTRARYEGDKYNEVPVFPDKYSQEMNFRMCDNEFMLIDYCSPGKSEWDYINRYLLDLVHPGIQSVDQMKGNTFRFAYLATYICLIDNLSQNNLFPEVKMYKDSEVECKDVDMVVDVGNSRTTVLLVEDHKTFNQVRKLRLTDWTNPMTITASGPKVTAYDDPFDMRLAFRRVDFGQFGINDSRQFVYPSFVRLGEEANHLIHSATDSHELQETLSTYSSPKRYLWDSNPNKEEWRFLTLPGEKNDNILNLRGITNQLNHDGTVNLNGNGGRTYNYSRRTLMTFSFLEMLVQARMQINSHQHREDFGSPQKPRHVKRIVITCPTAMSKEEREALVRCAHDAVVLLENFEYKNPADNPNPGASIEIVPAKGSRRDSDPNWYYDEATCAQLVYMYGEVGYKYKGCCDEFFKLYGKPVDGIPTLTVGSLDIGAGTTDLMISRYTYDKGKGMVTITPDPLFYDSFYYAGDDMLRSLVVNVMLIADDSAFRVRLKDLPEPEYRQKIKDFFGPDHPGETVRDRQRRKDFNIQYTIPLMYHYLELLKGSKRNTIVRYDDVFADCPPNAHVLADFEEYFGIDLTSLEWVFDYERVSRIVFQEFEPLLKQVATIMYASSCDIVILSGRPASLPPIRNIFLKYYPVSPNRLIMLNEYNVGGWYPYTRNTGYITDPKTIVAVGGLLGYYATDYMLLDRFVINLDKLKKNLKSTANYVEATRERISVDYLITPQETRGKLTVGAIPCGLNVRQLNLDTYPSRMLYAIDFDRTRIGERIRRSYDNMKITYTQNKIYQEVENYIDKLQHRLPFTIELERDMDDKEQLSIAGIADKNGNPIRETDIEIHIQSLGANEKYWLDSGAFDF